MSQFDPALGLPAEFIDLWSSTGTATVTTLSSSGARQTTATLARLVLDRLVVQRDAGASVAMVSDDFVSHDPHIDGREGLVDFIDWRNAHHDSSHLEVHHEFVSGDLVAIHRTDRHGANAELAVVDVLRIADGRITEYRGVVGADGAVADAPS